MTATPFDPEVDYLRALHDLLGKARSSWPVDCALASMRDILEDISEGKRIVWDHEADYLRARLAEVERAERQPVRPV